MVDVGGYKCRFILFQVRVVVFAFLHVLRSITFLGLCVVYKTKFAAMFTGSDAVQADIELGAILGVQVPWVGLQLVKQVELGLAGALESSGGVLGISLWFALCPVCNIRPVTDSDVFIEPEPAAALVLLGHAIHAGVEYMADVGLGMGVESIQAGAEVTVALWGLEFCPRIAVNIEVVITGFPLVGKFIKNKSILTQKWFWFPLPTGVVFVTLLLVSVVTVHILVFGISGALEVGLGKGDRNE